MNQTCCMPIKKLRLLSETDFMTSSSWLDNAPTINKILIFIDSKYLLKYSKRNANTLQERHESGYNEEQEQDVSAQRQGLPQAAAGADAGEGQVRPARLQAAARPAGLAAAAGRGAADQAAACYGGNICLLDSPLKLTQLI